MLPEHVHYFQHVPFERPAGIENFFAARGSRVSGTRFYQSWQPPEPEEIDLLVVMGGPMGVGDDSLYSWMRQEKRLIEAVMKAGKPVIGICLGAQLVAHVCGAPVTANDEKEIGWFPVRVVDPGLPLLKGLPQEMRVFHWHGDTFALPSGAVPLFTSAACRNQGFLLGDKVLGLQFHLELDEKALGGLIENCREELVCARYVQGEEEILAAAPGLVPVTLGYLETLLTNFMDTCSR